ncbi:metal ABC transporter ATP-binding protein [Timonella sp. A28]|uniref:metal ABC transporter ATP-binding protein n=1 Tax=Timonella sp. A28 TaxID=3442640 RepID=UPI003EBC307A
MTGVHTTDTAHDSQPSVLLNVQNLTVSYGHITALADADMTLPAHVTSSTGMPRGIICGLLGPNGSGKSSLFKALMGATPSRGTIQVAGLSSLEARKAGKIAYVPQAEDVDWDFPLSVREVVSQGRPQRRLRSATPHDKTIVQEALIRVSLEELADRQIGELSGGQKRRVFVARACAQFLDSSVPSTQNERDAPKLLLLDEPFSGVDVQSAELIEHAIMELAHNGVGVLVSVHDMESARRLCDEVVLLRKCVLAQGPTREVLTDANISNLFMGGDIHV